MGKLRVQSVILLHTNERACAHAHTHMDIKRPHIKRVLHTVSKDSEHRQRTDAKEASVVQRQSQYLGRA